MIDQVIEYIRGPDGIYAALGIFAVVVFIATCILINRPKKSEAQEVIDDLRESLRVLPETDNSLDGTGVKSDSYKVED